MQSVLSRIAAAGNAFGATGGAQDAMQPWVAERADDTAQHDGTDALDDHDSLANTASELNNAPVRRAVPTYRQEEGIVGPRVDSPVRAPELSPKRLAAERRGEAGGGSISGGATKTAVEERPQSGIGEGAENPFTRRARELGVTNPQNSAKKQDTGSPKSASLTPQEPSAKINRDIGNWKPSSERQPSGDSVSSAPDNPPVQQPPLGDALEDEERFFLEPIE